MNYFLGIDIGTGSARAGIFDEHGQLIGHAVESIKTWKPKADFVEQSSENIWEAICHCCHSVLANTGINAQLIKGIGFDATCSLVLIDELGKPVTVDPDEDDSKNIVVWMDHRAIEEARFINGFKEHYSVFDFIGGSISPEMQLPKLLWLKKYLPESWKRAAHFFDLPDYLTFRATGCMVRSLCSLSCKWTFDKNAKGDSGWDADFFKAVGLNDLSENDFASIGQSDHVAQMGSPVSAGLSEESAKEMGLCVGTPVGVSIIDAHAGGIGMLGLKESVGNEEEEAINFDKRLALIGGTSSCHMAVSEEARFIEGIWGPYDSAMVPGLWLNEGGQSATGSLVDHIIISHVAYPEAKEKAEAMGLSIYDYLNTVLKDLQGEGFGSVDGLSEGLHVCPYFHGNRSPRANPELVGMVSGLKLSATVKDLGLLYLATVQAIAYGTRHIIEAMNAKGYAIDTLVCCGGGIKNALFLQQHANITGCRLLLPKEMESVLLGSAMLGAVASGAYASLKDAMGAMSHLGKVIEPEEASSAYHAKKYKVFHQLYADQIHYDSIMKDVD
ncbi:MAG: FGGY-family carbohydrate kinase [Opitutae bacterium]|nr:FGGY-family carbohydrate kinase [Opitutae bacterium]